MHICANFFSERWSGPPESAARFALRSLCYTQALRAFPEVPLFPALCPKFPALQATF
jgi:hypothetical protein